MKETIGYESPLMETIEIQLEGYAICASGQNGYLGEGDDLGDMFNV